MRYFSIFLLVIGIQPIQAQAPFIKIINDSLDIQTSSVIEVNDGYIISSVSDYDSTNNMEYIGLKVDKTGKRLWKVGHPRVSFGNYGYTYYTYECCLAPDSTILFVGFATVGWYGRKIYVTKVNQQGEIVWNKFYLPTVVPDEVYSPRHIMCYPNGDFIVTGTYYDHLDVPPIVSPDSVFIAKFNANGDLFRLTKLHYPDLPGAAYNSDMEKSSADPILLPNGDIFFGYTVETNSGIYHPIFARLDSTLALIWQRAGTLRGSIRELKLATDTTIIAYIQGAFNYPNGDDPLIQKLNLDGDSLWTYSPPGISTQHCYSMSILKNNDIVFTGTPSDYEWIRCISPQGKLKWIKKYGPWDDSDKLVFQNIIHTQDGGMFIAGQYFSISPVILDVYLLLVKLDSLGCLHEEDCLMEYNMTNTNEAGNTNRRAHLFDVTGNMIGRSNPFQVMVTESARSGMLQVFDLNGRILFKTKVNGPEEILIPTDTWSPGYYLVRVVNEKGQIQVAKMVIGI